MPNPLIYSTPGPIPSPLLRVLIEHEAAADAIAPIEPILWDEPQKPEFTGNRHERRAQAARARKA